MKDPIRTAAAVLVASTVVLSVFDRVLAQPAGQAPVQTAASLADTFGGDRFNTKPSRDTTMSFTFPTEIAEVVVVGGAPVKKGDVLIRGRDEEYRFQRDLQQLMADSDLDIKKAEAARDQAQVEFDGQELAKKKNTYSPMEYDRARTALVARQVDVEIAKLQYEQQKVQLKIRQAGLDRLTLRAPFDGKIDTVTCDVGEVKKETEPVVRIVATDPLWIDAFAPVEQTLMLGLKPGDKVWVLMDLPGEARVYTGKIVEVGADAAFEAGKRRVRVELPNPSDWPSGLAAWVRFTPPEGEWAKRVVEQAPKRADGARAPGQPLGAQADRTH